MLSRLVSDTLSENQNRVGGRGRQEKTFMEIGFLSLAIQ